jgi:uncharacterized membrane protein YecN with MAPEG domain
MSGAAYSGFRRCCKRRRAHASWRAEAGADTMTMPITLTIAGAAALLNIWLGFRVSQMRRLHKVLIGDGGNSLVAARMRAHANFIEYTPFFLILLALIEMARGSELWLWGVAILYILGRLLHPFGMERPGRMWMRSAGVATTWLILLGLGAYAIAIPYFDRVPPPITYAGR